MPSVADTVTVSGCPSGCRRPTPGLIVSSPAATAANRSLPAAVSSSALCLRMKSGSCYAFSRMRICWLTAPWVMFSSFAASVKLRRLAATSKVVNARARQLPAANRSHQSALACHSFFEVPAPVAGGHASHPRACRDVGSKHRAHPVPPVAHGLMADLDPAFVQQVPDVPQRQREVNIQHHCQANDLGAGLEITEGAGSGHVARLMPALPRSKPFPLTVPCGQVVSAASPFDWRSADHARPFYWRRPA